MNMKGLKILLSTIFVRDRAIILELIVKVSISSFSDAPRWKQKVSRGIS